MGGAGEGVDPVSPRPSPLRLRYHPLLPFSKFKMKVSRTPVAFHPVTITLESRGDVYAIKSAISGWTSNLMHHRIPLDPDSPLLELDKSLSEFLLDRCS